MVPAPIDVSEPPPVEPLSALRASIAHQTYKRGAGQGPFKHSQSAEHALFTVRKAGEEVQLALGRIDHNAADLDGVRRGNERALLAGLEVLIAAAVSTEDNARKNLAQLNGTSKTVCERTPKHRDPRTGLRDTLASIAKLARALQSDLLYHQSQLKLHVVKLDARLAELEQVFLILHTAVGDLKHASLTKSAVLASPMASPRAGSAPATPRGGTRSSAFAAVATAAVAASRVSAAASGGDPNAPSSPEARARWAKLQAVMSLTANASPTKPTQSPRAAVAGSTNVPWSAEEDFVLIELIKAHGLSRWPVVAEQLPTALARRSFDSRPPRTSGLCKARWETLLNAYLSVERCANVPRSADLLLAARKASREAETAMNETAGRLTDAQSKLSIATMASQRQVTQAAERRGWLREHTYVKLHGESEEHTAIRQVLEELGPSKLLARKLEEVDRNKAGVDSMTLERQLGLLELVVEVGRLPGGVGARPRHFLRVRNQRTAEICLEWEEPRDQRNTNPVGREGHEADALTRKLHAGDGAGGGASRPSSSVSSTPRSSIM